MQALMTPCKVPNEASSDAAVPPELARSLELLRGLMAKSSRLEEIWQHFDTTLVEDDAFMRVGKRSENPTLRAVLEAVVPRAVQRAERLVDLRLFVLPSHGLWHGVALFEATWCVVIYFEAENRGLLVISKSPLNDEVIYARFSFPDLPRGSLSVQVPSNPSGRPGAEASGSTTTLRQHGEPPEPPEALGEARPTEQQS